MFSRLAGLLGTREGACPAFVRTSKNGYRSTGTITYGIPCSRSGTIRPRPSDATASTKYIRSHSGTINEPGMVAMYLPVGWSNVIATDA